MHLLAAQPGDDRRRRGRRRSRPDARRYRLPVGGRYRARLPRGGARPRPSAGCPACGSPTCCSSAHNLSVDPYVEQGGRAGPAGRRAAARRRALLALWRRADRRAVPRARHRARAVLPGDDRPDPELAALRPCRRGRDAALALSREGGSANARSFSRYAAIADRPRRPDGSEPAPLLRAGLYSAGTRAADRWPTFGRAAGRRRAGRRRSSSIVRWCRPATPAPIDALIAALRRSTA